MLVALILFALTLSVVSVASILAASAEEVGVELVDLWRCPSVNSVTIAIIFVTKSRFSFGKYEYYVGVSLAVHLAGDNGE